MTNVKTVTRTLCTLYYVNYFKIWNCRTKIPHSYLILFITKSTCTIKYGWKVSNS